MIRRTLVMPWIPSRRVPTRLVVRLAAQVAVVAVLLALASIWLMHLVPYVFAAMEQPLQAWGFVALLGLLPIALILAVLLWVAVSALAKEAFNSGSVSKYTSFQVTLVVAVTVISVLLLAASR